MSDLVARLRRAIPRADDDELVQEAADRIEALEAALREWLRVAALLPNQGEQ